MLSTLRLPLSSLLPDLAPAPLSAPQVRCQSLALLAHLLLKDYIKWRADLFLRFLLALVDEAPQVKGEQVRKREEASRAREKWVLLLALE